MSSAEKDEEDGPRWDLSNVSNSLFLFLTPWQEPITFFSAGLWSLFFWLYAAGLKKCRQSLVTSSWLSWMRGEVFRTSLTNFCLPTTKQNIDSENNTQTMFHSKVLKKNNTNKSAVRMFSKGQLSSVLASLSYLSPTGGQPQQPKQRLAKKNTDLQRSYSYSY